MKKILLLPALALLLSCSGGTGKSAETTEAPQDQIEATEESNQEIEAVIDSLEAKIDTLQSAVEEELPEEE